MKKIFLLVAASFIGAATVNAQNIPATLKTEIIANKEGSKTLKKDEREERKALRKLNGTEVSYQSQQAFERDFPNITPTSKERLDNFDEFTFTKGDKTKSAFYDADAKLVGTTENATFNQLPASAREYIQKNYPGYKTKGVLFFDDNELNATDMILFGLQFDKKDSYFVEMGKGNKTIVLQVYKTGEVLYFTRLT